METVHAFILTGLLGLTAGAGVLPDSMNAAVGESVRFNTTVPPTQTPFISIGWQIGTKNIITSTTANFTDPDYEDRITLFISTGSLELRNLAVSDKGTYRVTIIQADGAQLIGTTALVVSDPVSNVTVTVNSTDLIEGVSSVSLSCSASGSSLSFLWLNNSSELTDNDRVHITDGNKTVIISPVTRYDKEPFTCKVSNPVSSATSNPVYPNIRYGPDNIKIEGPTKLEAGQSLLLYCSAESVPVTYSWTLNGKKISSDSMYIKNNFDKSDSGTYICEASNAVTGRSLSGEHTVSVRDPCLSDGAVAGIAIACLVIGIGIGVLIGYFVWGKSKSK